MSEVDSIKNTEELREQEESFDETNVDNQSTENEADGSEDPELEAIKARVRDMEEEAEKLRAMNDEVEKQMSTTGKSMWLYFRPFANAGWPSFPSFLCPFSTRRIVSRRENGSGWSIDLCWKCT